MDEPEPVPIDPAEIKWRSPHEPINDTYWQITFADTPIPIQKILIWVIGLLVLASIAFFVFRKFSLS